VQKIHHVDASERDEKAMNEDLATALLQTQKEIAQAILRVEKVVHRAALEFEFRSDACGIASAETSDDFDVKFEIGKTNFKGKKFSETDAKFLRGYRQALMNMYEKELRENAQWNGKPQAPFTRRKAAVAARFIVRFELGEKVITSPPRPMSPPKPVAPMVPPAMVKPNAFAPQATFEEHIDDMPF